ncbi:MAG: MerR family transcriptional regulator [Actinomycetota bacterium]|nr:MerR family transcriptional regulator [Actinomycetota bacterium]
MSYSVGEVARFAGVTVRTLHHYDETGLLSPSGRTRAGYRRYAEEDILRLQQVLFYRELGFPLEKIANLLDDPQVDTLEHLRRQHDLLTARIRRLEKMVAAVELTMEARQMGINLTPDELLEVFGDEDPTQHAEEVEQRWGDSDAYRTSTQRTSSYGKEQWQAIKAEGEEIELWLSAALADGVSPEAEEAMNLAEAHRQYISRWFYDCPYGMQRSLADMYVDDPRFTAHYDDRAPGLARYLRDAIHANADRAEG